MGGGRNGELLFSEHYKVAVIQEDVLDVLVVQHRVHS